MPVIELLVTCLLAAGLEWTPPTGWTIDKIRGGGGPELTSSFTLLWCGPRGVYPEPDRRTVVVMRRAISPGDRVELPVGCSAQAEAKP